MVKLFVHQKHVLIVRYQFNFPFQQTIFVLFLFLFFPVSHTCIYANPLQSSQLSKPNKSDGDCFLKERKISTWQI